MKVLVTGSAGMLGQDLVSVLGKTCAVLPHARRDGDITDVEAIRRRFQQVRPDVVIHAAAFTAVDECERQPELAMRVNGEGARNVALACAEIGAGMVYISTDYVFDGEKSEPYVESDTPNPINVYGQSKLAGERYVANSVEPYWIVRISWLFGRGGKNFVESILAQARRGGPLRVVSDQIGAPTYTVDLAGKIGQLIQSPHYGIFHVTNQGFCSWFDFAREILRQAGLETVPLSPIASGESKRPARRPKNSCLAPRRLEASGLGLLPPWQDALARYLGTR
jgi:dTDP-4-dehydrorhamnose reductase